MRKILLVCNAGMSTSLLMTKMREYAETIHYDIEVVAHPVAEVSDRGGDADVILLGPQVRFKLNDVKSKFPDKPVETIDMMAYGTMDGKKVVEHVKTLLSD
ncbi:PTS sugar transporter subunit IIB [Streptococcus merionis]|uniref:Phosphotransferase system cellobiose-specific component IIB n=1 Tax=Streptococcus merionis TaxID=400065 RepID=A0A239SX14_9STRE|nr:PTS sugar transporter subunit IIB [Streptococcus merionis]SNU89779.1 phosphotransferase system cellobiose-specific component IIB [Streptococcus merionis]